ncbi:MAG: CofH family radical SAM protein [Candidatus Dadabacteria bacterium]|nr:MAG: CofH family radical SAM protein [Candidatus Dadabacteria bacterium]
MEKSKEQLKEKIVSGKRITPEEAYFLYKEFTLPELGWLAHQRRCLAVNPQIVTFLIDRNINYTNVCNTSCSFCAFYVPTSSHKDAYVLSKETLALKIKEALDLGATRILLQGGHNDDLPFSYYLDLIQWIKSNFPIAVNAFSPSEINQMCIVSGKTPEEVLLALKNAGLDGLPGGGAEILDDEVRKRISPKKISAKEWLYIMSIAQELELTTSASMVIGFGESIKNRINHLENLRALQEKALANNKKGFSAFISWTAQLNKNTSLGRSKNAFKMGADVIDYLKNVAVARIYLDNISHHQGSWPTLGTEVGKLSLYFGCDDFGSTMMEENVVSKAGGFTAKCWSKSPAELCIAIREAGFTPAQRDSDYNILKIFKTEVEEEASGIKLIKSEGNLAVVAEKC